MMWLNGSTVSRIFGESILKELLKKAEEWGNKLEAIGTFSHSE